MLLFVSIAASFHPAMYILLLSTLRLASVGESKVGDTFHHTGGRIAKKFASGFEGAVDPNVVFRRHEEVGRRWRVVRCLFGNVISSRPIGIVPVAGKYFSEDRIQRFLHTSLLLLV